MIQLITHLSLKTDKTTNVSVGIKIMAFVTMDLLLVLKLLRWRWPYAELFKLQMRRAQQASLELLESRYRSAKNMTSYSFLILIFSKFKEFPLSWAVWLFLQGIDTCTAFYSTDCYSRGGSCQSQSSKDHKLSFFCEGHKDRFASWEAVSGYIWIWHWGCHRSVLIRIEVYHVIRNAVLHEANLDWRGDRCSNSQRHLIGQVVPERIIG